MKFKQSAGSTRPKFAVRDAFIIAAWFAAVSTLLEVWSFYSTTLRNPSVPAIGIAFYFSVYLATAAAFAALQKLFPRFSAALALTFLLSAFTLFVAFVTPYTAKPLVVKCFAGVLLAAAAITPLYSRYRRSMLTAQRLSLPFLTLAILIYVIVGPVRAHRQRNAAERALPAAAAGSPNVIVIVLDTVRADHLSSYGYARQTTPNIDQLAHDGVLFENAIAAAPWTTPSHASMITGLYPVEHHVEQFDYVLDPKFPTIGKALMGIGYQTGALSANEFNFSPRSGMGAGFLDFPDFHSAANAIRQTSLGFAIHGALELVRIYSGRVDADCINREAVAWMGEHKGPFFLFLNYLDVHSPYQPPLEFYQRFSKNSEPSDDIFLAEADHYSPAQLKDQIDGYDASLAYVDFKIGELRKYLESRGLDKNTIVLLTSDHGEAFNDHGFMRHGNALYRELVRVPLIVWAPGRVPAGMRIKQPVSTTALPATILDMAGGSSDAFRSPSIVGLWKNSGVAANWPDPQSDLAQMPLGPQYPNFEGPMRSITTKQWQCIVSGNHRIEVFDYLNDPEEKHELSGSAEGKQVALALQQELAQTGAQMAATNRAPQSTQKSQQKLHTLGYVY